MTKKKLKFNLSYFVFLLISIHFIENIYAYSEAKNCKRVLVGKNNMQFSQNFHKDTAECVLDILPRDGYLTMWYRSYYISSSGLFMIFNSYGDGPSSTTTGAREFYFLPRRPYQDLTELTDQYARVVINHNVALDFMTTKDLKLINNQNITFKVDPKINKKNKGGVEIVSYKGVYLDVGFSMGRSPSENKESVSTFVNSSRQKCQLKNKFIFDYKNGNIYLFGDSVISQILQKQCPKFIQE